MRFVVCAASQVASAVAMYSPAAVVSLISPDATAPAPPLAEDRRLILRFNDIEAPRDGLTAPDAAMMTALFAFARRQGPQSTLLLHCFAGISRSPAAAFVLACAQAPGAEARLAARLRARSPECTPNLRMVALGDALLGRGGALVRAIEDLGRGCEAFEGATFHLP